MAEKPIIFSTAMVQAILGGRKTQTRRVIKTDDWPEMCDPVQNTITPTEWWFTDGMAPLGPFRCPYGKPGDALWVRETWQECAECGRVNWRAGANDHGHACQHCDEQLGKWRPSIFMPRWASRITLTVTGIRVERVQDISEADAQAEGVSAWIYVPEFKMLWDAINAKRGHSWASNPWVWVVEFEVKNG